MSEAHCESELHSLSPRAFETTVRLFKLKRGGRETVHFVLFPEKLIFATIFWCILSAHLIIATAFLEPSRKLWPFNADMQQLMSLCIDSLYSSREIFLRVLILESFYALDKISYECITDSEKIQTYPNFFIKIIPDKTRTITIKDSGIGVTESELVKNLGTIAKSGTKAFMEAMKAGGDIAIIGHFGVGYYSANLFLVPKDTKMVHGVVERGTKIIFHMKEEQSDF